MHQPFVPRVCRLCLYLSMYRYSKHKCFQFNFIFINFMLHLHMYPVSQSIKIQNRGATKQQTRYSTLFNKSISIIHVGTYLRAQWNGTEKVFNVPSPWIRVQFSVCCGGACPCLITWPNPIIPCPAYKSLKYKRYEFAMNEMLAWGGTSIWLGRVCSS